MILAFTLSMPGCPSWNGRWSGEGRKYVIVRSFTKKIEVDNAAEILKSRSFHYSWSDGWMARIDIHSVTSAQAKRLRKESNGFCGYDWMVDTIIKYGKPLATHEIDDHLKSLWEGSNACLDNQ